MGKIHKIINIAIISMLLVGLCQHISYPASSFSRPTLRKPMDLSVDENNPRYKFILLITELSNNIKNIQNI
jgi:hypothetical protein